MVGVVPPWIELCEDRFWYARPLILWASASSWAIVGVTPPWSEICAGLIG
jgi:hypothetical protein